MVTVLSHLLFLSGLEISADILRLLIIPAFIYAAILDYRTRRVHNEFWIPLFGLLFIILGWDILDMLLSTGSIRSAYLYSFALSVIIGPSLAYTLWQIGFFGGADAKAFIFLSVYFPTIPEITLNGTTVPQVMGVMPIFDEIFVVTIFFNALVFAAGFQLYIFTFNIIKRNFNRAMTHATKYATHEITEKQGVIIESNNGINRPGVDIDTLRMYLRWRGETLNNLLEKPIQIKNNPPEVQNEIGDGSINDPTHTPLNKAQINTGTQRKPENHDIGPESNSEQTETDNEEERKDEILKDEWAINQFDEYLDDNKPHLSANVEHLPDVLNVLHKKETVWVIPGIPFFIPLTLGLITALFYGSIITGMAQHIAVFIVEYFVLSSLL